MKASASVRRQCVGSASRRGAQTSASVRRRSLERRAQPTRWARGETSGAVRRLVAPALPPFSKPRRTP